MLVYTDILTGDEMFSDAYAIKEVGDVAYEIDCKLVTEGGVNVDIGANPSAEEGEEALDDNANKQVIDVIHHFRLQSTVFDKKSYLTYLKGYMKAIKGHLHADRVKDFEANANEFAKKIVGNFKDYEFYIGEGLNPDGMVALLNYRSDGITPYLTFWKDGLKEVKQ